MADRDEKNVELTIGIITCGRPQALSTCIKSIQNNVTLPHKTVIVDSTGNKADEAVINGYRKIYADNENIEVINSNVLLGPAASRKLLSKNVHTNYLLYLDDDIEVQKNSIESMIDYIKNNNVDIVSGIWREYGKYREAGQYFHFGKRGDDGVTWKSFLPLEDVHRNHLTFILAHSVQATMLLRSELFERVQFDERFDFFYDLWDFFMQCYHQNLKIGTLVSAEFEHKPLRYKTVSTRAEKKDNDRQKFYNKWGMLPLGNKSIAGNLSFSSVLSYFYRHLKAGY